MYVTVAPAALVAGTRKLVGTSEITGAVTSAHDTAPTSEVVPVGHSVGDVAPAVGTYEPAGAGVHVASAGAARYEPGEHHRPTVTVKLASLLFPTASAAEHVTTWDPIANAEPEGGAHVTGRAPSTTSVAVGVA